MSDLSLLSGLSPSHICKIENGQYRELRNSTLRRLEQGLSLDFGDLQSLNARDQNPVSLEEMLNDKLLSNLPVDVPLYTDYPADAKSKIVDYAYLPPRFRGAVSTPLRGYLGPGDSDYETTAIVYVADEVTSDTGTVVCRHGSQVVFGPLDDGFIHGAEGTLPIGECSSVLPVIATQILHGPIHTTRPRSGRGRPRLSTPQ